MFKSAWKNLKNNEGNVTLTVVILVTSILITVSAGLVLSSINLLNSSKSNSSYIIAKTRADSCIEESLSKIRNDNKFQSTVNLAFEDGSKCTTTVSNYPPGDTTNKVKTLKVAALFNGYNYEVSKTASVLGASVTLSGVAWQQSDPATNATDDKNSAYNLSYASTNFSKGLIDTSSNYSTLLTYGGNVSSSAVIDYKISATNMSSLVVGTDMVNVLDSNTRTASLQYSTDNGITFNYISGATCTTAGSTTTASTCNFGSTVTNPTTVSGSISFTQGLGGSVIVRINLSGAAGASEKIGIKNIIITPSANTFDLIPRTVNLTSNGSLNTTFNQGLNFNRVDINTGVASRGIVAGDFNGDGKADFIQNNYSSLNATLYTGNGSGGFTASSTINTASSAQYMITADFNNDGYLDFAIAADSASNNLGVWLNNGTGTFSNSANVTVSSCFPANIGAIDFNGDGKKDIALFCSNGGGGVKIFLNNGSGGMTGPTTVTTGGLPVSGAVGDVNNDGKADLVTAELAGTNGMKVYLGNGNGTFGSASVYNLCYYTSGTNCYNPTAYPRNLKLADVNGDGKLDVLIAGDSGGFVSVYLNSGTGTFPTTTYYPTPNNGWVYDMSIADFNGDGILDLALTDEGNSFIGTNPGLSVLYGIGDGTFTGGKFFQGLAKSSSASAVADFNNDGKLDVVIAGAGAPYYTNVYLSTSTANYLAKGPNDYFGINVPNPLRQAHIGGDLLVSSGKFLLADSSGSDPLSSRVWQMDNVNGNLRILSNNTLNSNENAYITPNVLFSMSNLGNISTLGTLNVKENYLNSFHTYYQNGGSYTEYTTESKTSAGTPFPSVTDASQTYLWVGRYNNFSNASDVGYGKFSSMYIDFSVPASNVCLVAEYYNGTAWTALTLTDGTSNFTTDGSITFTPPADWATYQLGGYTDYWVRFRSTCVPVASTGTINLITGDTTDRFSIKANPSDANATLLVSKIGNVGINASNPNNKLQINTAAVNDGLNIFNTNIADNFRIITNTTGGAYGPITQAGDKLITWGTGVTSSNGGLTIMPWSAGVSGIRIDGSGNVAIGSQTNNPNPFSISAVGSVTSQNDGIAFGQTASGASGYTWMQGFGAKTLALNPAGNPVAIGGTGVGSGRQLDVGGGGDGITIGSSSDNVLAIQSYIDAHWSDRTTYASGCCNTLNLQPDIGFVGIGVPGAGNGSKLSINSVTGGPGLTGTAVSSTLAVRGPDLPSTLGSNITIASFGDANGNWGSLGIHAYRHTAGTGYTTAAMCLGYNVDNTTWVGGPLCINSSGYIGLNIGNPTYRLQLPNTASPAGQGQANAWVTYSSQRWKENVTEVQNAMDYIMKMRGVFFDWKKEEGGGHDIGFIAEEVAKVIPELATYDTDGQVTGLKYDRITSVLVEGMKEQQEQLDALSVTVNKQTAGIAYFDLVNNDLNTKYNIVSTGGITAKNLTADNLTALKVTSQCTDSSNNILGDSNSCSSIAQKYNSSEATESGDLVEINIQDAQKVQKSSKLSKLLVGVVTNNPGLVLGLDGKVQTGGNISSFITNNTTIVAMSGKTQVKVNNENGNIIAGDSITSSSVKGVGMKASSGDPIIGIALESPINGKVTILISKSSGN